MPFMMWAAYRQAANKSVPEGVKSQALEWIMPVLLVLAMVALSYAMTVPPNVRGFVGCKNGEFVVRNIDFGDFGQDALHLPPSNPCVGNTK